MAISTSVKFYSSAMPNAPQMTPTKGSMIAVLDACLKDGWGLTSIDSITVSGGIATATMSAGNQFMQWSVVTIAGATPAGLNGEKRVLTTTTNTFTFDATGVADGAASGTITGRVPPLGWLKPFSGTNIGVYKVDPALHPETTGCHLRVDDNGSYSASVFGYESMSDVNTGTGKFPTDAQVGANLPRIFRSDQASGTQQYRWWIIGDGRFFYFGTSYFSPTSLADWGAAWHAFGEFPSRKSADPYNFLVAAKSTTDAPSQPDSNSSFAAVRANNQWIARGYAALGGSQLATTWSWQINSVSGSGPLSYPNGPDYGLYLCPLEIGEVSNNLSHLRGRAPGLLMIPHTVTKALCPDRYTPLFDANVPGYAGRVIGFFPTNYSSTTWGVVAFDLSGPWEH